MHNIVDMLCKELSWSWDLVDQTVLALWDKIQYCLVVQDGLSLAELIDFLLNIQFLLGSMQVFQ